MTQKGQVLALDGDYAVVRVMRKSACDGCNQKNLCAGISSGCSDGTPLDISVKNTVAAAVGDNVVLSSPSGFVLGAAFGIFVAPIIIAVMAYFICAALINNLTATYIVTAVFFAVSIILFCFGLNEYTKKKHPVEILRIL